MEPSILLKAENIFQDYEERKIIEGIHLSLKQQEVVSLLGVSGVGKSTLFHILSGLLMPKTGKVWLNQKDITGKPGKIIAELTIPKTQEVKEEYGFTKEFLEYKKQIRELLK